MMEATVDRQRRGYTLPSDKFDKRWVARRYCRLDVHGTYCTCSDARTRTFRVNWRLKREEIHRQTDGDVARLQNASFRGSYAVS